MKKPNRKNSATFSLRTTLEKFALLKAQAASWDMSVNAYADWRLFKTSAPPPPKRRSGIAVEDREAVASILARLAQTQIWNNINQMARLAHSGSLPVTPEVEALLVEVRDLLRDIRNLLMKALGRSGDGA